MRVTPIVALLLLASCGDDGGANQFPDGGLDGAQDGGDEPVDGQQLGAVTVVVSQGTTLVTNAAVYFQNADGSLVAKVMTDATGRASQGMAAGGYVTVASPFGTGKDGELYTFMGVKPGDVLQLPDVDQLATDNLVYTSTAPAAGTWEYQAWVSSGTNFEGTTSSSGNDALSVVEPLQTTVDGFIVARSGQMAKYVIKRDVALAAVNPVLAFGGTWLDLPTASYSLTNIPGDITRVEAFEYQATPRGIVYGRAVVEAAPTAGTINQSQGRVAVGTTEILQASFPVGSTNGERRVYHWQPATDALTFSYANTLLAPFTSATSYSAATKTLSWTEGTGVEPDGVYLRVDVESTALTYRWTIVAPHTAGALVFPALPTELNTFNLTTGYVPYVDELETFKVPGGYDVLRSAIFVGKRFGFGDLGIPVPGTGSGVASFQRYRTSLN